MIKLKNINKDKFSYFNDAQRSFIELLFQRYPNQVALCGGALRALFDKSEVKDLDFYVLGMTEEEFVRFARQVQREFTCTEKQENKVVQYHLVQMMQRTVRTGVHTATFELTKTVSELTDNPIGRLMKLAGKTVRETKTCLQLIWYNDANCVEDILANFDITACMFGYDGKEFTTTKKAIKDASNKILSVNKIDYPILCARHILKYKEKGYKPEFMFYHSFMQQVLLRILEGRDEIWMRDEQSIY